MRVAALDVGSNSVHMVIADVHRGGRLVVVDRVKEMVRLGRRAFVTGKLGAEAMDLAVETVKTYQRLARARRVAKLRAVATSAVREARNGRAFVARVRRETGVPVEVISGAEEARLIFRATRHALALDGDPYLLVDIGGGSVELGLVTGGKVRLLKSLPLGVARLTDRFLPRDPPRPADMRRLERHLDRVLGSTLARVRAAGVTRAVGTSGTINTLVVMARSAHAADPDRIHGAIVRASEIAQLRRTIVRVGPEQRVELRGMDGRRVDLMPAAAILVDFLLAHGGIAELQSCAWALREGVLLDLVHPRAARSDPPATIRRRSVEALAARWAGENRHGRHVARLARILFDTFGPELDLDDSLRELLEYGALVHDIGHAMDRDRHHRHGAYLVRNAELLGFAQDEVELLAELVRTHRKQPPKPGSPELRGLPASRRRVLRGLSAILRLADALDRTHVGVVNTLRVSRDAGRWVVEIDARGKDAELERWAAERRAELLSRLLGRPLILRERVTAGRSKRRRR